MNVNGHGKGQVRGFVINWLMELSSLEEDMGPYVVGWHGQQTKRN